MTPMKVHVKLIQQDLLAKETHVIADTDALLKENKLSYFEGNQYRHDISFLEDEIVLQRRGDFSSLTRISHQGSGTSEVSSPYGQMKLDVQLCDYRQEAGRWMVEYMVMNGSEATSHLRLIWEIVYPA
jgi:uncharacterized beta-barrel protein YwiB (DUF1934 family)